MTYTIPENQIVRFIKPILERELNKAWNTLQLDTSLPEIVKNARKRQAGELFEISQPDELETFILENMGMSTQEWIDSLEAWY